MYLSNTICINVVKNKCDRKSWTNIICEIILHLGPSMLSGDQNINEEPKSFHYGNGI